MAGAHSTLAAEASLLHALLRRNHSQFARLRFFRQLRAVSKVLGFEIMSEGSLGMVESAVLKQLATQSNSKDSNVGNRAADPCSAVMQDCMIIITNCLTVLSYCDEISLYLCEETKRQNFVVMYTLFIALSAKIAHVASVIANNFNDYYVKLKQRMAATAAIIADTTRHSASAAIDELCRKFEEENCRVLRIISSLLLLPPSGSPAQSRPKPALHPDDAEDIGLGLQGSGDLASSGSSSSSSGANTSASSTASVILGNISRNASDIRKRSIKLDDVNSKKNNKTSTSTLTMTTTTMTTTKKKKREEGAW